MRSTFLRKLAVPAAVILILSGIVLPHVLGSAWEDYSAFSNYLSELGAKGAPAAGLINWLSFLPVAAASAALILLHWHFLPPGLMTKSGLICMLGVSVGYLGAFIYPCDAGCPATGSQQQSMHNFAGLIQYAGVSAGLLLLTIGLRRFTPRTLPLLTLIAFILVITGFVLMTLPGMDVYKGLAQRTADYSVFVWLCIAARYALQRQLATTSRYPAS